MCVGREAPGDLGEDGDMAKQKAVRRFGLVILPVSGESKTDMGEMVEKRHGFAVVSPIITVIKQNHPLNPYRSDAA